MESTVKKTRLQGHIERLSIEGFRSIANVKDLELAPLGILIGANGSGKTNLVRFFDMLSWMLRGQNLQEFVVRQGGGSNQLFNGATETPRLNAEIRISTESGYNDYRFGLAHLSAGDTLMFVDEGYRYSDRKKIGEARWSLLPGPSREAAILEADNPTAKTVVGLLKRCSTYQFHDTSQNSFVKQMWDCDDCAWLRSDGANLAPILNQLKLNHPDHYQLVVEQTKAAFPDFDEFDLQPAYGKVMLRWRSIHSEKLFPPHLTSDGTLRLFCLITLLNLPHEMLPDVMIFDEPELGLHPQAIATVAEMLRRASSSRQILIATHSPYLADCFELDKITVVTNVKGETKLTTISHHEYEEWLDSDYLSAEIWSEEEEKTETDV